MQSVLVFNAHPAYRIRKRVIEEYVKRVVGKRKAQMSVIFVDSHRSKTINRTFLNHNYVTDVVSFCLEQAPILEGEVYVNLDRARQQAQEYNVSFKNEVARLVIHGCLHVIGFDDKTTNQKKKMKLVEDKHVRHWFTDQRRKEST